MARLDEVRRATRDDIGAMVAILRRHHAEHRDEFGFEFDAPLASLDLAGVLAGDDWLCLVSNCCLMVGFAYRPMFAPVRFAVEVFLRCERPGIRPRFVAEFEAWARAKGCIKSELASTYAFERFGRLYARDGYRPSGMTFAKVL